MAMSVSFMMSVSTVRESEHLSWSGRVNEGCLGGSVRERESERVCVREGVCVCACEYVGGERGREIES